MKSVDEFLKEQENKPIYMYVYSYYDKKLEQFNQPQIEDKEPSFMATACRSALIKGTFKREIATGLLYVYLGKFNIKTGEFELLGEDSQIIVDCDKVLNNEEKEGLD